MRDKERERREKERERERKRGGGRGGRVGVFWGSGGGEEGGLGESRGEVWV